MGCIEDETLATTGAVCEPVMAAVSPGSLLEIKISVPIRSLNRICILASPQEVYMHIPVGATLDQVV